MSSGDPEPESSDEGSPVSDSRSQAATTAILRFYHKQVERPIDDHIGPCSHPECEQYRDIEDDDDPRALAADECSRPSTAREYFNEVRGYTDETIDRYCLGWAPPWSDEFADELIEELCLDAGFSAEELAATGLFFPDLKRPKWEGRYVLPYFDADHEQPIYGIARCTGKKGGGHPKAGYHGHPADRYHKYDKHMKNPEFVNSPDEPIFGVDSIEDGEPLLIAGGIADAITLQQAGYPCVSPVTTVRFKGADLREFIRIAWDRDIPRVYIVNDAEPPTSELKELPNEDENTEFDRIGRKLNIRPNGEGRRAAINNAVDFLGANIPTFLVDLPQPSTGKVDPDDVIFGELGNFDTILASAKPARQNTEYQKRAIEETTAKSPHQEGRRSGGADGPVGGGSGDYSSDGKGSALYSVSLTDLDTVRLRPGDRGVNPFGDHGDSDGYFEVYSAGEVGYDYKYKATYNGLTGILVEAEERDAADPQGALSFREHLAAWDHAKEHGYIPDDDPIPTKALWQVVVASDETEFEAEDWVWRARLSSETDVEELENEDVWPGKMVGESDERKQEVAERLPDGVYPGFGTPKGAYNLGLEILDGREVEHGREKVPTGDFAPTWDDVPCYNENGRLLKGKTRRRAAGLLCRREEFVTPTPQGAELGKTPLYHYDEGTGSFGRTGTAWVNQRIGKKLPILGSTGVKEVVNLIKRQTYIDRDTFDAGEYDDALVNLKNGVYNLDTGELEDHSPEYRFRTSIPQEYYSDAECPNIEGFIEDIVPDEQERRTLFEWAGFCLETGYPINRFLILHGNGRNGKSIYLRLLREFLSEDNVSGAQLDTIAGGQFGVAALEDSLLNIDAESADTRLGPAELNTIKAMTGGDIRQAERKFEEPFDLQNTSKLAFAANNPPRFEEETDAIADRLLAIEFPFRFKKNHEDDPDADKEARDPDDLLEEMTTEEELSGFLNKALEGLQRVRENRRFSIEEDMTARERFDRYQTRSDSIVGFAVRCLENQANMAMPKGAVYNAYKSYCADHDHTPAEKRAFFRQFGRKTDIEVHSKQPKIQRGDDHDSNSWRPRVLDHCWITTEGLSHLSEGGREDTLRVVEHMNPAKADYAQHLLLRTGDEPAEPEGETDVDEDKDGEEVGDTGTEPAPEVEGNGASGSGLPQAEKTEAVTDAIQLVCQRDDGVEHARHGDIINVALEQGVEETEAEHVLDKLSRDGKIIQPATGQYRLNN